MNAMKKLIFIATLLITAFTGYAQNPGFTFGPKIGATFSRFHSDINDIKEEAKSTMHWGAFARLGSRVYIQPELLFMNKTGIIKSLIDNNRSTISLRTIDVPLLFGVKVTSLPVTNVRIFAGPVATLVVNRDVKSDQLQTVITEDNIRRSNWGLQFGAGADLLMFTIDLRYELGMGEYSKINDYSLKNNLITVSVGWKIL